MAKKRSWYFYLFIFAVSLTLVGYLLWTFTPVKNEVKAVIIKKLQPYLGESFLINDFSLGFTSISFYEIRAANHNATFALDLEEIRIGFNPLKLITHQFQPVKTIESVTVISPQLSFYYTEDLEVKNNGRLPLETVFEEILTNIQKFPEIDYVSVVDGGVRLQMRGGKQFPLLNKLKGRLNYLSTSKQVDLDLSGEFLGAPNSSITLLGNVDFAGKNWSANLVLDECVITSNWPFWKLDFFQVQNARLQGELKLTNPTFALDSLRLNGAFDVKDFSATLYDQHASAKNLTLRFDKRALKIEPFDCVIEDGQGRFGGSIDDVFKPEVDWKFEFADYSTKYLKQSHDIFEYAYEGKLNGEATISGPFKSLDIRADIHCPDLLYAVVPFNSTNVKLNYNTHEKKLIFTYIRADFIKFRTRGTGQVDFNSHHINLQLNSDIYIPDSYFSLLNGLNKGNILIHTDFKGDYSTKLFGGSFSYRVLGEDTLFVKGRGPFTLDDQLLNFNLLSDNIADDFKVDGTIRNLFSDPYFEILDVNDFLVKRFTKNPLVAAFVDARYVNFYFAGPYNSLGAKMKIVSRDLLENKLTVTANIRDIFMEDQKFMGEFTAHTAPRLINGKYNVSFSPDGIDTQIDAPNLFRGNLFIGATSSAPFIGRVYIQHFPIADYLKNSPSIAGIFEEGYIKGEMDISGTVQNPQLAFNLSAADFIVNQVGYYSTEVSGRLEDYVLSMDNFWVRLNSDRVFNADFSWNLITDSLKLAVRAENIESNFLAETIFKDADIIRGSFNYAIIAGGQMSHPAVYGDVEVREGIFKDNPFHSIIVSFEDSLVEGTSFWELKNHIVKIRKFLYINRDEYTIEGNGIFGIDEYSPIDIEVNVNGNVLAELPRLQSYFKNPQSNGSLFMRVKGSRGNPYFEEIDLKIFSGSLEFDGVIPPLTNLKAEVELTNASDFIHINTIEGRIGDHWARIYNEPAVKIDGKELPPWLFEDIGLNFGVFVLDTGNEGIPLAIPGMMEEGDIGYFAAKGKRGGEKFYFAGPPDLPLARGTLVLYNCRVTFPFIGMYDEGEYAYEEDNKVVDFLMNMRWDVETIPGNNNRYFVNIPAYVGEVFMDLNIDNSSPGLDFSGRLIDESFRVEGSVESSRGRVEYLDVNFKVERFGAEFNRFEIYPEVYGRAYTTVRDTVRNSTESFPRDIYLELYVIDPVTKKEVSKGRWEDFRFKLVSHDQVIGETQEQVLSYLGYSVQNLQNKAGEVGLTMTENFLIRPLYRPIERQLERRLKLDYVRLRSNFTTNLFYLSFQDRAKLFNNANYSNAIVNNKLDPALLLLQSSELTLGKYLLKDIYLSYTGQLVSGYEESKLGVNHTWGLEYRLLHNLLLEIELNRFQFNPFYSEDVPNDFRIRLRHSFNF